MHQQIRVKSGTPSATDDGTGAMSRVPVEVDPLEIRRGALMELLRLLEDNGYDLALAAGDSIELGGEFTFALKDHDRTGECAALLRDKGYREVRRVQVEELFAEDRPGGLRAALEKLDPRSKIDEIYVGATREDGLVPIQVTTVRFLDE